MAEKSGIVGLEAQYAPTADDDRVGFAVTHGRPAVALMFPIDEADDMVEDTLDEE